MDEWATTPLARKGLELLQPLSAEEAHQRFVDVLIRQVLPDVLEDPPSRCGVPRDVDTRP